MNASRTQQLLRGVARRERWARFGLRFYVILLVACGVYLALLLVARLLGIIPPWFKLSTLLAPPLVALVGAILFHRSPTQTEAARLVDGERDTKDLFLTAATIGHALGAFQELVITQAEQAATGLRASQVRPFRWQQRAWRGLVALVILAAGVSFLPQLDPFGRNEARLEKTQQQMRLAETAKATQLRNALLLEKGSDSRTKQVDAALAAMLKTFNTANPTNQAGNLARLNDNQKELGKLWRDLNAEQLKNAAQLQTASQRFGLGDPAKIDQWKTDLRQGDTASVNRELNELKDLATQASQESDPVKREKLQQELANRLQALADALAKQTTSEAVNATLQRALEQLQLAQQQGLSQQAMKAMMESLDLSQQELEQLAQSVRDLQKLEEALKTLQLAKQANQAKGLDGEQTGSCQQLSDYAAMYQQMCQGQGPGAGESLIPGSGEEGGGIGVGPREYGDEKLRNKFVSERSASPLQPGKLLLEWKTQEMSDPGEAREEYQRALQDVRQEASEAILKEQVPAGYHSTIKTYFDALSEHPSQPAKQ